MSKDQTTTQSTPWWVVYFYDKQHHEIGRMIVQGDDQKSVADADYGINGCDGTRALMIGNDDNLPHSRDRGRLLQGAEQTAVFDGMRQRMLRNLTVWARSAESHGWSKYDQERAND